ncbi:hypothetical protein BKA69DRAFT_1121071 [Paraphysoderma sedebokerense]|nr:hypothetical protein BKA69DRAFT_1121071 [Paraphysoderma sedebokerense]
MKFPATSVLLFVTALVLCQLAECRSINDSSQELGTPFGSDSSPMIEAFTSSRGSSGEGEHGQKHREREQAREREKERGAKERGTGDGPSETIANVSAVNVVESVEEEKEEDNEDVSSVLDNGSIAITNKHVCV